MGADVSDQLPPGFTLDQPADASLPPGFTLDPQPETTARGVAKNVAAGVIDAGAGMVNTASDPVGNLVGKPIATAGVFLHDLIAPWFGGERFPNDVRNMLLGDNVPQPGSSLVNRLGDMTGVDLSKVPATTAERYVRAGTAGAGMMATGGPVAAAMGAGGAVAGQAASDTAPDWAKPMAELTGNVIGAKGTGAGARLTGKTVNAIAGVKTPLSEAYDRLGIDRTLIGDVSGNPTAQQIQAYGSQAPFGSAPVTAAEKKVVEQFGQKVEDTANSMGGSMNAQAAGDVLQTEARNWRDVVFPQRQAVAWAPVDQIMTGKPVDVANYRDALTRLTGKLAALPETQKVLLPARIQGMLDAINVDVPPGSTIPWQQAQMLRSAIGNIMGVPEIVQTVGKDQLKAAYGGISEDMRTSATAHGAAQQFADANKVSTDGHAFIENTLTKIIKSNNPAQETVRPEQAADTVLGSGDTTLQAVRRELPVAADHLAAYKLRDMAKATPGQAGATGNETSVATFLTDLNRLRQAAPNGERALFADPAVRQKIEDLAKVADSIKDTARRVNVSKTGPFMAFGQLAGAGIGGFYAGGVPGAIAAVGAPIAANKMAGGIASSPTVTRYVSTPSPQSPINALLGGAISNVPAEWRRSLLRPAD